MTQPANGDSMGDASFTADPGTLPEEFTSALAAQARADAEFVGRWLRDNFSDVLPLAELPYEFILGVAFSLKLCQWEVRGIRAHLEEGLPSGPQSLVEVFHHGEGSLLRNFVDSLGVTLTRLAFENFLWSADESELSAFSLALQADFDDEQLLDVVADYLATRVEGACP
jgi:hypothetical protein